MSININMPYYPAEAVSFIMILSRNVNPFSRGALVGFVFVRGGDRKCVLHLHFHVLQKLLQETA